ncbi:MAG: aminoglycoside phosphotransferase family protein [Gemmatimonadales bacterium]
MASKTADQQRPGELEARLDRQLRAWSVEVEHVIETRTSSIVFGRRGSLPVVLKVAVKPGTDEWRAGAVLAAFRGRGTARVYEQGDGATLMERIEPGTPLVELVNEGRDQAATGILAELLASMDPAPREGEISTVERWSEGFARYAASGDPRIPGDLLSLARRAHDELSRSQSRRRLLHGDLQHCNVLLDRQRGWLAIDPKGVIGEVEYELGASLRNPTGRPDVFAEPAIIERRVKQLASGLALDERRILGWAFAQGVLSAVWSAEDGEPVTDRHAGLLVAKAIRPML